MHITEVTFRSRNDFHFVAHCKWCGKSSRHGDGYADHFYQSCVFPDRHCEHCGMNEHGETVEQKQQRYAAQECAAKSEG